MVTYPSRGLICVSQAELLCVRRGTDHDSTLSDKNLSSEKVKDFILTCFREVKDRLIRHSKCVRVYRSDCDWKEETLI